MSASSASAGEQDDEEEIMIQAKWMKDTFEVSLPPDSSVQALKHLLAERTNVLPKRQKLMGLKHRSKGTPVDDDTKIEDLTLKKGNRIMMIGPAEENLFVDLADEEAPDVINDLDEDFVYDDGEEAVNEFHEQNLKRLKRATDELKINIINEWRPGRRLLVLDLDYTLFDMKSRAASFDELKRPFMDEFLAAVYPFYDIVIWSQTSWRWLEIKLTELGILSSEQYKIAFVLDKTCMWTYAVRQRTTGDVRKHQVKALQVIWDKLPQFGPQNTIHIDDLGRNFAMNPQSGLKIKAFKKAAINRARDRELVYLARYLGLIARVADFRVLRHGAWKEYVANHADDLVEIPPTQPQGQEEEE